MLEIVTWPHPALRYLAHPVERIDDTLRTAVRAMFDLMYEARGIGLAATQVALPFRFFVLNLTADPDQPAEERVFINPVIVKRHGGTSGEEGCLSFPGLYAPVPRARKIKVQGFDLEGREFALEAEDLLSRAIQHELDHLDGKLFVDYLTPPDAARAAMAIRKFEKEHLQRQQSGELASDLELKAQLDALASGAVPWPKPRARLPEELPSIAEGQPRA